MSRYPVSQAQFVEDAVFFLQCMFLASLQMLDSYSLITHVWIFSFVPLICFCANPILYLLLCICTISEIQMLIPPALFFLLRIVLAIQGLL